jgi:4-hydroxybenzoate polyprenyltransferase
VPPPPPSGGTIPYERVWAGKNPIKAIVALTHPTAVILFSLVTWILAAATLSPISHVWLCLAMAVAMAGAQASVGVFNEVFDWKLDRETKPWRAIPAGMVSPARAAIIASALLGMGLLVAASISFTTMLWLFAGAGMGILYSAIFKRTAWSWLPYAICYPSVPVWVQFAAGKFDQRILLIYLLAGPYAVAVHLCNQLRDFDQDAAWGIRGLVQRMGPAASTALCFTLALSSPLPFLILAGFSGPGLAFAVLLIAGLAHWGLTVPIVLGRADPPDAACFRSLFRRLQFTGPLMLLVWYGIYLSIWRYG